LTRKILFSSEYFKSIPFAVHFIRGFWTISPGLTSPHSTDVKLQLIEQHASGRFLLG
jgi:hypothetical protein